MIFFRTDASLKNWNWARNAPSTLAKELRKSGALCKFLCRDHDGNLIRLIRAEGFGLIVLTGAKLAKGNPVTSGSTISHADWLETHWQLDAEETNRALVNDKVDWLIVDHYGLDKRWEELVRPNVKRLW